MANEQRGPVRPKELVAADKQLTIALGIDHEELLQKVALRRMFNAAAGAGRASDRIVQLNAWLQGLELELPELAATVKGLYPCSESKDEETPHPCSLCVITYHDWDSEEEFQQAEAECKAIAEELAELLAAVPGPIERVDVIPNCHDSNLAEVAVRRSGEQLGGGQ